MSDSESKQAALAFWKKNEQAIRLVLKEFRSPALHSAKDREHLEWILQAEIANEITMGKTPEEILKEALDLESNLVVNAIRQWWMHSYIQGLLHHPEDHLQDMIGIAEEAIQHDGSRAFFSLGIDTHGHRRCLELASLTMLYAYFLTQDLGFDPKKVNKQLNDFNSTLHQDLHLMLYSQQVFRISGDYPKKRYQLAFQEIEEEYIRMRESKLEQPDRKISGMIPKECHPRVMHFGKQMVIEQVMLGEDLKHVIQQAKTPDTPLWRMIGFRAWSSVAEEGRMNIPPDLQKELDKQSQNAIKDFGTSTGGILGIEPDTEDGNKYCLMMAELSLLHLAGAHTELKRDRDEITKSVFKPDSEDAKHVKQQFTFLRMLQEWQKKNQDPKTIN